MQWEELRKYIDLMQVPEKHAKFLNQYYNFKIPIEKVKNNVISFKIDLSISKVPIKYLFPYVYQFKLGDNFLIASYKNSCKISQSFYFYSRIKGPYLGKNGNFTSNRFGQWEFDFFDIPDLFEIEKNMIKIKHPKRLIKIDRNI